MSFFIFLTVVQAIVAAALVGVVLMQRSEGGGLGIGGSPGGALGARGAADFLSRSTKWLAVAFVTLSIVLAALAVESTSSDSVTTTLDRDTGEGGGLDLLSESETTEGEGASEEGATGDASTSQGDADDPLEE